MASVCCTCEHKAQQYRLAHDRINGLPVHVLTYDLSKLQLYFKTGIILSMTIQVIDSMSLCPLATVWPLVWLVLEGTVIQQQHKSCVKGGNQRWYTALAGDITSALDHEVQETHRLCVALLGAAFVHTWRQSM